MIKKLVKKDRELYYYKDGVKILGVHKDIYGDISGIYGDISNITGNITGISGDISGIYGDISNIAGDIDKCNISAEDREKGIHINNLING